MLVRSRIFALTNRFSAAELVLLLALPLVLTSSAKSQTYQLVHQFTGPDGENPMVGLTIDAAGRLYGTTLEGGASGLGSVFRLTRSGSAWVLNTLYSFGGNGDGDGPMGRVVFGPDGALYGTTNQGGNTACNPVGCGTVFKLQPPATFCRTPLCPWTKTTIHTFAAQQNFDGQFPVGDLTFDPAGNLYGVTTYGGQHDDGTVYELSPSNGGWTETIIDSFGIIYHTPEAGVTFGADGNLYGTLAYADGNPPCCYGAIYALDRSGAGWTENILYVLGVGGTNDGGYPYAGVIFGSAGNLYGATTELGTNNSGTVFELSRSGNGWSYSVLYSFTGNQGSYANLTFDQSGNLYGTTAADGEYRLGSVFKLGSSANGWTYSSLHDFDRTDGAHPESNMVFDTNGNLYGTVSGGGQGGDGGVWEVTP
jgi:uncharacterized repeat protein (TIGR03803 family)